MTACVIGHPAAGHIQPTLPVVAELVERGEHVVYWATEPFRGRIETTGAEFRSYGEHALFERSRAVGGMLGGMADLYQTTEEILPALLAAVRGVRPDYLLVEAHAVWGNLLAQILDVPAVALCPMFAMNNALIRPAELLGHLYGRAPAEGALDGMLGLTRYFERARRLDSRYATISPGIVNYLGNRQELNIVFTSREFQIGGGVFDGTYHFVGPSTHPRSEAMDFELPAGNGPLVYIAMGTMYNDEAALYHACFEAFAGEGLRVVMAVGRRLDRTQLSPPPPNFVVRDYVPQQAVLAQASLFITHGGINSAQEAMLCGVPMIVLPCAADHYGVAQQVERVGAGIVLDRAAANAANLLDLSRRVLGESSYQARSRSMGESLRAAGGHQRAAQEILNYAAIA